MEFIKGQRLELRWKRSRFWLIFSINKAQSFLMQIRGKPVRISCRFTHLTMKRTAIKRAGTSKKHNIQPCRSTATQIKNNKPHHLYEIRDSVDDDVFK
jgi:hypothetical protein